MKNIEQQPTQRSIFIWNIAGSLLNAMLSVVLLMLVTRFLDDKQSDIFSIAWTISQLMATIGTFQIRVYQATDVMGVFCFRQYWIFRLLTIGIMLFSSCVYVVVRGYQGEKVMIVLMVCVFRAIDSLADVYEGWFQLKERLDLSGKALSYRVLIAFVGFGMALGVTKDLIISCVMLILAYGICYIFYDIRYNHSVSVLREEKVEIQGWRWVLEMAGEGFPLFVNAFLMMSILNAPKMVLDTAIEQGKIVQGGQTIFNILFMPAMVLNLMYIVFRPLITKMAIVWNEGKKRAFLSILRRILICLVLVAIAVLLGSAFFGIPVLSVVYAVDLTEYKRDFLIVVFGGCMYTFAAVLDNALVVIRRQYLLVVAYVCTFFYIKVAAGFMVNSYGIEGAALSYTSAMVLFLGIMILMFAVCFFVSCKKDKKQ